MRRAVRRSSSGTESFGYSTSRTVGAVVQMPELVTADDDAMDPDDRLRVAKAANHLLTTLGHGDLAQEMVRRGVDE